MLHIRDILREIDVSRDAVGEESEYRRLLDLLAHRLLLREQTDALASLVTAQKQEMHLVWIEERLSEFESTWAEEGAEGEF